MKGLFGCVLLRKVEHGDGGLGELCRLRPDENIANCRLCTVTTKDDVPRGFCAVPEFCSDQRIIKGNVGKYFTVL